MPQVATTVAGLGTPSKDGQIAFIRVGAWPEQNEVMVKWNAAQGRWIGEPMRLAYSYDTGIMQTNETNWGYLNSNVISGNLPGGSTALRWVAHVNLLYAAGLRLQDRSNVRTWVQNASGTLSATVFIVPWFHQFDSGDWLAFANDVSVVNWPNGSGIPVNDPPSGTVCQGTPKPGNTATTFTVTGVGTFPYPPNIGPGNSLSVLVPGGGFSTAVMISNGWQDVTFKVANADGTSSATTTVPTKKYLYAPIYAYRSLTNLSVDRADGNVARFANYSYEMRWTS